MKVALHSSVCCTKIFIKVFDVQPVQNLLTAPCSQVVMVDRVFKTLRMTTEKAAETPGNASDLAKKWPIQHR